MQERHELVDTDCKHADCVYRNSIRGEHISFCGYILEEGHSRGCKISECDKYKSGKKTRARMHPMIYIEWEREFYE